MAIMGSGGIHRDTDAASPIVRNSTGFQPQNVNKPISGGSSLPRGGNLSNASNLKNSNNIAKPQGSSATGNNPLKQAAQRRNAGNNYTRPSRVGKNGVGNNANNGAGQQQGGGSDLGNKNSLQDKNPLTNKNNKSNSLLNKADQNSNEENEEDDEKSDTDKLREQIRTRIKNFLKRHPVVIFYIVLIIAIIAVLYIVLSAIITVLSGGAANEIGVEEAEKTYGDFFDFDRSEIYLLDENGTKPIGSRTIALSDYVKGLVYADTMSLNLSGLNDEQLKNFYMAVILTKKAEVLSKGHYSNKTKSMSLKVTDFNYCDASYGCKLVSKGGRRFYLANGIDYSVDSVVSSYDAMDYKKLSILNEAYRESMSMVVTPTSVNTVLTEYTWSAPATSTSIYNSWISNASNGTKYEGLITGSFPNYKVYKLKDYATQFESVYLSSYSYWWPIGSATADANGLYSDDPTSTTITSKYGPSFSTQTMNKGITIAGTCNSTKVIAIADGTVSYVGKNDKYGNYVIINHDDNIQSLYGSLASTKVSKGSKVVAGQLVGLVGKINDTSSCELYFEMYSNGANVNPEDYISGDSPRASKAKYIKFVQGVDNKQTVCKTFLASGFNKNAVAGLMANIERESGFRLNALSDGGTSNGLFQWHKGRLTNLQNYCGAEYLTSIKCQLDFFYYEITVTPNAQNGIFNYLMGSHSAYDMGYQFCMKFERPAGGATSAATRGELAQNKYASYVNNGCQ